MATPHAHRSTLAHRLEIAPWERNLCSHNFLKIPSPVGAAYSAPDGAKSFLEMFFYQYAAPTALAATLKMAQSFMSGMSGTKYPESRRDERYLHGHPLSAVPAGLCFYRTFYPALKGWAIVNAATKAVWVWTTA